MRKQVSEFKANTSEYKKEFTQANYCRISVTIPKEQEAAVKAHAEKRRLSVNGLINELLRRDMRLSLDEWKGKEKQEDGIRKIKITVEEPEPQKPLIFHCKPEVIQKTEPLRIVLNREPEPEPEPITFKLKKEE